MPELLARVRDAVGLDARPLGAPDRRSMWAEQCDLEVIGQQPEHLSGPHTSSNSKRSKSTHRRAVDETHRSRPALHVNRISKTSVTRLHDLRVDASQP